MSAQVGNNSPAHPYTCNTCQVAFRASDLQRAHMQSDWHRYNLKRRVASLPPLTSDIFAEKVLANQASAAATAAQASFEKRCTSCERSYFSQNAYQNHLGSQKHKIRLMQLSDGIESMTTEDDTASIMSTSAFTLGEPINKKPAQASSDASADNVAYGIDRIQHTQLPAPEQISEADIASSDISDQELMRKCLFCNLDSPTLHQNITHMRQKHGMFVPEQAYLVDPNGLILWLQDRVRELHECLYCGMVRTSTFGAQTHMRDKGHCKIAFESEMDMVEVGQFYDFRSTYSDEGSEAEMTQSHKPRLGAGRKEKIVVDGQELDFAEDEDWESDASDATENESTQRTRPKPSGLQAAYADDFELHLPSGRTAGHRSLARYFRQNLHNYSIDEGRTSRTITDGRTNSDDEGVQRPRARQNNALTRANGGMGMLGVTEQKKLEAKALEVSDRRRAQRQQNRYQAGNERRGNQQKHFRDPLLQ